MTKYAQPKKLLICDHLSEACVGDARGGIRNSPSQQLLQCIPMVMLKGKVVIRENYTSNCSLSPVFAVCVMLCEITP